MSEYFSTWYSADDDAEGIYRVEPARNATNAAAEAARLRQHPGGLLASVIKLDEIEEYARQAVRPFVVPSRAKGSVPLNLGDGRKQYKIDSSITAEAASCKELLVAADVVRGLIDAADDPQFLAVMAVGLGRIIERLAVLPIEPLVKTGKRATIVRPQAMRDGKAKAAEIKRRQNYKNADAALQWAREHFPTATADNKISFLKKKAAEHLGINVGTLNRRLRTAE